MIGLVTDKDLKKLFYIVFSCLLVSLLTGCVTTGTAEYFGNGNIVIYGSNSLKDTFDEYSLVTDLKAAPGFCNISYLIGSTIENNMESGKPVENLPLGIKRRSSVLIVDSNKTDISYYKWDWDYGKYISYEYKVELKQDKAEKYCQLTREYVQAEKDALYWEEKEQEASMPVLTKTRRVPYTAYNAVRRSRAVTKFRTVYDMYGSYTQPYTDYEWYTEYVPYTAYREETYTVPNPDFNVDNAKLYRSYKESYIERIVDLENEIDEFEMYEIYKY